MTALVRRFRQSLIWPLQLLPRAGDAQTRPWEVLLAHADASGHCAWQEVVDEYTGDADGFHERHYNEFVTFLPHVQRFLYGEGHSRGARGRTGGTSSMRVLRRNDVAAVSVGLTPGDAPIRLAIEHIDLIFFFDVDVIVLNVELHGQDLPLAQVQELLYRLGRAYPPGWDDAGRGLHCPAEMAWLGADGRVLARSDAGERDAYLAFVGRHRAPRFSAHWRWLMEPLRPETDLDAPASAPMPAGAVPLLRYRQIEYHRMPLLAWLTLDEPRTLSRADFVRLGLVSGQGGGAAVPGAAPGGDSAAAGTTLLPYGEQHLADFETRHCYDRFWCAGGPAPDTRYLSCGHALVVVGRADSAYFNDRERGVLGQFRHQHAMLFLIAHFQKAALLMFSDRLVVALDALDIQDANSVKRFKRAIRANFENFLRFTHRYWFHDIAEQAQARALYRLTADHLAIDTLYAEVRERVGEMNNYLDTDSLRRQANTVIRLTVVTIAGLIGTLSTGFLGMNLLAEAEASLADRAVIFVVTVVASVALTAVCVAKSKRLSDLLDLLSDDRLGWREKLGAFWSSRGS
ncbi:MAG: hypothetical protein RIQ60_3634 [Pseudomonadota bacterium]